MSVGFKNITKCQIKDAISASDVTILLQNISDYVPFTASPGDYVYAVLRDHTNFEIIKIDVAASTVNGLSVSRGQESTSARAWKRGTLLYQELTAASLDILRQKGVFRSFAYNPNSVESPAYFGEKIYDSTNVGWWKSVNAVDTIWVLTAGTAGLVEKGFQMGGLTAIAPEAMIEELIFGNETSQAIAATLDTGKYTGAGVNSSSKGYVMGGITDAYVSTAVIEDLIFSDETSQVIITTLDVATRGGAGVNSSVRGYVLGGYNGAYVTAIETLVFSNEASFIVVGTLDTGKLNGAGVNSSTKGYIMGGYTAAAQYITVIEDLVFSNETSQVIAATLDIANSSGTGVNSSSKGYLLGGKKTGNIKVDTIEDLIFSTEASQAIAATLDTAKWGGVGVNSSTKGYVMGGLAGALADVIEDLIFSDETSQAIAATLDTANYLGAGVQSGYV